MLIMPLLVLEIGLIKDVVHLLEDVLDAFNKIGCFISLGLDMCGLCLCSLMRHDNINQTQWLKTQTHLKRIAASQAMERFFINVSQIREVLILDSWMLGVVYP